jgi:hypothetical protein
MICFVISFQPKPIKDIACRVVCVVHALGVCVLAAISNLVVGPWAYNAIGEANTPLQSLVLEISLGYFVFDFLWCLLAGNENMLMLVSAAPLAY